jgi:hypothetical protein
VDVAEDGKTSTKRTRVSAPDRPGPVIASWLTQEEQLRGEALRDLREAVQAAKDGAAEAIRDNRIPAKYRPAVKRYFRDLDEKKEE